MKPAARVAAAIEILDAWRSGVAAEQALTRWGRRSRFAGSGDRAAVRDYVFDVLRAARTAEVYGGSSDGRALMIGLLRTQGKDPGAVFTGEGHAPSPLTEAEAAYSPAVPPDDLWNLPDWLVAHWQDSLGAEAAAVATSLQNRAPVTVRVNAAKGAPAEVQARLRREGIETRENPLSAFAMTVTEGARRLRNSKPFQAGEIELQDASSQAVVALLPQGRRCLDFCAGGGGKSLALAAQDGREVFAHDLHTRRTADILPRAARAGCHITVLSSAEVAQHGPYDVVLCDVPCSGSGAWRRTPDAKWAFTPDRLDALCKLQQDILGQAADVTRRDGTLVYATCSVLKSENEDAVAAFLGAHPQWQLSYEHRFPVSDWGDGFYTAHLKLV